MPRLKNFSNERETILHFSLSAPTPTRFGRQVPREGNKSTPPAPSDFANYVEEAAGRIGIVHL